MTRISISSFLLLALALLLAPLRTAQAAESYDNCKGFITTLPTVISTQGTWCLKGDLSIGITSGNAITINTNNVTIDCNNYKIGGLPAGLGTQTNGIYSGGHLNTTVRHCNIRGFYAGLYFESGGGDIVEDNIFQSNTYIGIFVGDDGSVIRRNQVVDTGASTVVGTIYGIYTANGSADIIDNAVSGVSATVGTNGNAYGIYTDHNNGGRIIGNGVRNLFRDGTGLNYGNYNLFAVRLAIRNNDLVGDGSSGLGLRCTGSDSRAKENIVNGFTTQLESCSDDGGNVFSP